MEAPRLLQAHDGPATTPSGAAGLAGVMAVLSNPANTRDLGLYQSSRVLVLITERVVEYQP